MNDLENLADALHATASALLKRVDDNFDTLNTEEKRALRNQASALLQKGDRLLTEVIIEIGAKAKASLKRLSAAQEEMNKAIKTIENVQQVIDLAAKLVSVATKVLTGDIGGIASGVDDILGSL